MQLSIICYSKNLYGKFFHIVKELKELIFTLKMVTFS